MTLCVQVLFVFKNIYQFLPKKIILPCLSPAETMSKLAVGKLVQATAARHTEVAPHILAGLKVQVLHGAGGGLESLVRVLGGDTGTDHMTLLYVYINI